jgi:predicted ATPase/DNA-binding SARP family transcriptional activator
MERWLLALLILRQERETQREWLAVTLWPDSSDSQALNNLRRSLSILRSTLGTDAWRLCTPTSHTLRFDLSGAACDVVAFDQAIAHGDTASLEQAVVLYRGPLLEEYYAEWILPERERREQAYLMALETLARDALARQAPEEAARHLRAFLAIEPLRESAQRALMQALAAGGDYAAVTQAYRDFRLRLHEEMRATPSAETTALYHRLRQQGQQRAERNEGRKTEHRPRNTERGAHNLPSPITSLIGREEAIQEVVTLMAKARLATLTGAGGVGKTRLAIAVAEALEPDFPDGVCFVDLSALSDASLVPLAVVTALQLRPEPGCTPAETLQAFLARKALLLVLDNCEHLQPACAALSRTLLSACPDLRILATSRQAVGIVGERRWGVPSLSLPDLAVLAQAGKDAQDYLLESAAAQLFVERAQAVYSPFRVTAQNCPAVGQACCLLDGIPFAIELAAAWARVLPVQEIVGRIRERLDLLTSGDRTAPTRQQTLRAALDWSCGLLSAEERRLLWWLSVFAGGFTLKAVERVCGEAEPSPDALLMRLARLADQSLVVYEERDGEARYRLLETTRQYAQEKLQESNEREAVRLRHRDYFLALAEEARPHLSVGGEQVQWLNRLETEHDNFRAALDFCKDDLEGAEASLHLCVALSRFWEIYGYLSEGRAYLAAVLSRPEVPTKSRGEALNAAAGLTRMQGDYPAARVYLVESLEVMRELGNKRGIAMSLDNLGLMAREQGDYDAAHALHSEGLAVYREANDLYGVGHCLNNLGLVAYDRRDYAAAHAIYCECLAIWREVGDRRSIAMVLSNLGLVANEQGNLEAARAWNEESLRLCREIGEKYGAAGCLNNLGLIACNKKDYANARAFHGESLAIRRELGDRRGIAMSLGNLGFMAREQGDYGTASACYHESLTLCRELGEKYGIAEALAGLSALAWALGQLPRAVCLGGAETTLRESIGATLSSREYKAPGGDLTSLHAVLGDADFSAAWAKGCAMSLEEAVEYALREQASL